jgi:hypothetical protein
MITYTEEPFEVLWEKVQHLIPLNNEEINLLPDRELDLDVDKAVGFQNRGMLLCCAAWDDDVMVGYIIDVIDTHSFYKDVLFAHCDLHFVQKEYRGRCARGLLRFVEKIEREMGVVARVTRSLDVNRAGDFFKAIGYSRAETAWVRRL